MLHLLLVCRCVGVLVYGVGRKSIYPGDAIRPCPLILYGYGSYGICIEPDFEASRITMLDRGVAWAIAHIRGKPGNAWLTIWYIRHHPMCC